MERRLQTTDCLRICLHCKLNINVYHAILANSKGGWNLVSHSSLWIRPWRPPSDGQRLKHISDQTKCRIHTLHNSSRSNLSTDNSWHLWFLKLLHGPLMKGGKPEKSWPLLLSQQWSLTSAQWMRRTIPCVKECTRFFRHKWFFVYLNILFNDDPISVEVIQQVTNQKNVAPRKAP